MGNPDLLCRHSGDGPQISAMVADVLLKVHRGSYRNHPGRHKVGATEG